MTFTRRGECFSEPHRPRHESCTNDMAGIMSPKPVRTADGVCRMGMAPVSDDEEDDEEEDDTPLVKADACAVCGKPTALVDADTCQYDDCPYR